jgi:LmbE family N-acetylglucosaminyl deacetylase
MRARAAHQTHPPRAAWPASASDPAAAASATSPGLAYRVKTLPMAATVLELGAHPDDEDTGMLVHLSHGRGARAVYWSATRGEGGQNRRGPELEEALGIVRTWESLQARALDGGQVLYGPFYDYGYCKHGDDALRRWGREEVVREIVRAIRLVQPLVVVSRWSGGAGDGHGHHQAIGLVAEEAFGAAADGSRFPELAGQGLRPWRARKLYFSVAGDWQPGEASHFGEVIEEYEHAGYVRIATGDLDPVAGATYQEQASLAVNCHRSQGMGFVPTPGPYFYYYRLAGGGRDTDFFDGLDPTLTGLADGSDAGLPWLRERLLDVRVCAESAVEAFRPFDPAAAGLLAAEGASRLRELLLELAGPALAGDEPAALEAYVARKARQFDETAAACLGLRVECLLDRPRTTPGRPVGARVRVWNTGPEAVEFVELDRTVPDGWSATEPVASGDGPAGGVLYEASFQFCPPDDAQLTVPYWLHEPRTAYRYAWPESESAGRPLDPPLAGVAVTVAVGGHRLTLGAAGLHTSAFPGGFRRLPLSVLPPLAVSPHQPRELLAAGDAETVLDVAAAVHCLEPGGAVGTIGLRAPDGWAVEPSRIDLGPMTEDETRTVRFEVTVPAGAAPGAYGLAYEVDCGGRESGFDLEPVRLPAEGALGPADKANCGWEAFRIRPAAVSVELVDVRLPATVPFATVEGMPEGILRALARFELDITELGDEELEFADLGAYGAIVVGPNAYNLRSAVRENAHRLLAYVAEGGTLIVQYQAYGYELEGLAPYPFRYHEPHDRVTAPDAPVEVLEPEHPVVTMPNRLTAADFDGWVHERGLYFFGEWDPRYRPILASADPGEPLQAGGLLTAHHGRGTYVYVAYSLHRQIPAGVPGAIRLLANLLGLAEARIRARVELLRGVRLLEDFSEAELSEAAGRMAEHTFHAGEYLTRQGGRGAEMFILTEGQVEVVQESGGAERVLGVVEPPESLGELAVLARAAHTAGLRARGDVTVLVLKEDELHAWLGQHPDLALRLLARIIAHTDPHR